MIENAQFTNEKHEQIRAVINGGEVLVPVNPANRHYRAIRKMVDNGILVISDPEQPTVADVDADCLKRIDRAASRARARFITEGVGQDAVYLTKYAEAVAYQSASDPVDSDYPYLAAEAARRNMTVSALAQEVIDTRNAWTDPAGATIEAERVGGKGDVRSATSVADKQAAADAAIATLDGITP